jgi:hypothetical protein
MDGQLVLLTGLSGLLLIVLLLALAVALSRIYHALERINVHAGKIRWGVRAIEKETDPLRAGLPQLKTTLTGVVGGAGAIAQRLESADGHLQTAADALAGPRA